VPKPREHWYAGKRFKNQTVLVVFGFWEDVRREFQFENHSRCKRFNSKEAAMAWVNALPFLEWPKWGMREDGRKG